jgi:hypothetical protein
MTSTSPDRGLSMQMEIRGTSISVAAPVFLADMDHANARLRLHVRRGINAGQVQSQAQTAVDAAGLPVEVVVRSHDLLQLAYPRSLEHWLNRFQLGEVIHDPTMIVSRARVLLEAAKACRIAMGAQARGVFFDPGQRTLLVLIKGGKDGAGRATREWVRSLVDEVWALRDSSEAPAKVAVQVVTSLPRGDLVPVDTASASIGRRIGSSVRRWLAPLALLLAAGAIAGPAAAKTDGRQPAYSAGNAQATGKVQYGVLTGLSVFAEGQRRELDAFAARGLNMFFGDSVRRGQGVLVAARETLRRANLSDVDAGTAQGSDGAQGVGNAQGGPGS